MQIGGEKLWDAGEPGCYFNLQYWVNFSHYFAGSITQGKIKPTFWLMRNRMWGPPNGNIWLQGEDFARESLYF